MGESEQDELCVCIYVYMFICIYVSAAGTCSTLSSCRAGRRWARANMTSCVFVYL